MDKFFKIYILLFPYILFLNVLSFGSHSLGFGTILFISIQLFLILSCIIFLYKIKLNIKIFLGLSSFFIICLIKFFFYNSGNIDFTFLKGGIGSWLFFIVNYLSASLFLKNAKNKNKLIEYLSLTFVINSIIGILHYYFFYSIPFIDPSYDTDEYGTIFHLADYDLMRFRETSIYFGANVNAYLTVLGYFFLVFNLLDKPRYIFSNGLFWIGLIIHSWNIYISDSRSGFILIFVFTFLILKNKKIDVIKKIPFIIKLLAIVIILTIIVVYVLNQPRLQPDILLQDPRFIKIAIGISILTKSTLNLLIGAPINDKWTIGDVSVSDNMYIAIALYVGLIGLAILICTVIFIYKKISIILNKDDDGTIFNLLTKYILSLFLIVGIFAVPIGMMPFIVYLGVFLGAIKYKKLN